MEILKSAIHRLCGYHCEADSVTADQDNLQNRNNSSIRQFMAIRDQKAVI
ncbi:hypothetical protein CES86_4078 [Brucella lupini]|uniref:Uncharacterized protein n=1 Tax=Brucella lupini TaxID=255457 RepID=A0A256GFV9_9HYPH|nr:hypothetical protein CES86_4078 [Brucella lupini]